MNDFETDQIIIKTLLTIAAVFSVIGLIGGILWMCIRKSEKKDAEREVQRIIDKLGMSSWKDWKTDDEREILQLINMESRPARFTLWARITVTKDTVTVRIEYSRDLHRDNMEWAEEYLVPAFKKRGIDAYLAASPQMPPTLRF